MNRSRSIMISFLAAGLAALLVYGVYVFQLKQVELQRTVNVVVPKDFIKTGTMINEHMLEYKPVFTAAYKAGMIRDMREIAGKETMVLWEGMNRYSSGS